MHVAKNGRLLHVWGYLFSFSPFSFSCVVFFFFYFYIIVCRWSEMIHAFFYYSFHLKLLLLVVAYLTLRLFLFSLRRMFFLHRIAHIFTCIAFICKCFVLSYSCWLLASLSLSRLHTAEVDYPLYSAIVDGVWAFAVCLAICWCLFSVCAGFLVFLLFRYYLSSLYFDVLFFSSPSNVCIPIWNISSALGCCHCI